MDHSEKRNQILEIVNTLPQCKHLSLDRIDTWISNVMALNDHDPAWHARRLRGIGSSEIGSCVMTARGEHTPFGGAREMVMSKLMILSPAGSTGDTLRGNEMEDFIRTKFHRQYGTKSETDMMNAMMGAVFSDIPWMVGNPDDLCLIDGKLYVVDYKAPRVDTLRDVQKAGGVKFEYACQLHHLQEIGRRTGLPIEGKLLCSIDWDNWELDVRFVQHDQGLLEEMIEVGNELWHEFVCQGEIPEMDRLEPFEGLPDQTKEELFVLTEQFMICDGIAKQAAKRAGAIKEEIISIADNYSIGKQKIVLPGGYIKANQELDLESLHVHASMFGVELDTENPESIQAALKSLEEQGYPQDKFECETKRLATSRSTKGLDFDFLQACKEIGEIAIEEKLDAFSGNFLHAFGVAGKKSEQPSENSIASKSKQTKVSMQTK